jgi:predicted ferric reductase
MPAKSQLPPETVRRHRLIAGLAVAALLVLPLGSLTSQTGAMTYYLGEGYPPGQGAYIMMRIAGHLAFALVFLQIVLGLKHRGVAKWLGTTSLVPVHRSIGLAALMLALSHPILFEWARQLRTGQSTVTATFWPPTHTGFYELHQFFGAIGLYLLIVGVIAGVVGPRLAPRAWKTVHYVNYAVFFLVWYHSFRIGTSTRIGFLPVLYSVLAAIVVGLLVSRLLGSLRPAPRKVTA